LRIDVIPITVHRIDPETLRSSHHFLVRMTSLRDRFLRALDPSKRAAYRDDDPQGALSQLVELATKRHPSLAALGLELPSYLASHIEGEVTDLEQLFGGHAGDLLVALGCVRGEPAALGIFFAHYTPEILRALRRLDLSEALRTDLQQDLHARLLVGDGDRGPLLARYRGSGPLRRWLQATAINTALKVVSRERLVPVGDAVAVGRAAEAPDPELELVKRESRAAFDRAIRDAFDELSREERLLLRQHFVDGSSIDVLARLYRVHRATAARRLVRARTRLFDLTRRLLEERLDLGQPTFRSLCRLLVSQLDVSLAQLDISIDPE
jgi:RNA polymerase sigma-70 factor (ECF subfamily)